MGIIITGAGSYAGVPDGHGHLHPHRCALLRLLPTPQGLSG